MSGFLDQINDWLSGPGILSQSIKARDTASSMGLLSDRLKYIMANDPIATSLGVGNLRPYANVPNSLMGFRKNGPNVGFDNSNYPHSQPVKVTIPGQEPFFDEIKGMNKEHALERARRNWDGAKIEDASAQ